jgi:hypothetical protein
VYQGAPFGGDFLQFTVQSVPEPSTLTLGILATLGVLVVNRREFVTKQKNPRVIH